METFSVFLHFPDGGSETVASGLVAKEAVELSKDYSTRPAAMLGIIQRITIIDGEDFTVFDWQHGKGVVFPTQDMRNARSKAS